MIELLTPYQMKFRCLSGLSQFFIKSLRVCDIFMIISVISARKRVEGWIQIYIHIRFNTSSISCFTKVRWSVETRTGTAFKRYFSVIFLRRTFRHWLTLQKKGNNTSNSRIDHLEWWSFENIKKIKFFYIECLAYWRGTWCTYEII